MELVDAYTEERAHKVLYDLLRERQPHESISHKRMPTWAEHCRFVDSRPYQFWYLVRGTVRAGTERMGIVDWPSGWAGAIYLTERLSEIGVHLFRDASMTQSSVITALMELHPRPRFVMNIAPKDEALHAVAFSLGFKHIQNTYELVPE